MTYTPGPWTMRETPDNGRDPYISYEIRSVDSIAHVAVAPFAADARLIAAAPALYEALRQTCAWLEDIGYEHTDITASLNEIQTAAALARAAIALVEEARKDGAA